MHLHSESERKDDKEKDHVMFVMFAIEQDNVINLKSRSN